jgi:hypothetical protein
MPAKLIPNVQGKSKIKEKLTHKENTTKRKQNDFSVA